jgi:hypothetical protein
MKKKKLRIFFFVIKIVSIWPSRVRIKTTLYW